MKEAYNWKSLFIAAVLVVLGIGLIVVNAYISVIPWKDICMGVGCSLIASAIVIAAHDFVIYKVRISALDEWGIDKIYATRAEKNSNSDPSLDKAKYCVDGIAFGLSSFRTKYSKKVERCLRKGVNFRFLVMNPQSEYLTAREKEENSSIRQSIEDLIKWADRLNADKNNKGKIIVKGYNAMTLDFYWRVDDDIYVGPYWYQYKSSDTITYRFSSKGKAFTIYTDYFEKLWENKELATPLTQISQFSYRKRQHS
jgi:hypothetical protein